MEKILDLILEAIDNKHGKDTVHIALTDAFTDHFIITTGNSPAQTQAIADEVERVMGKENIYVEQREGYREGSWILLDFGNIVLHVFLPEQRQYYSLEKLLQ